MGNNYIELEGEIIVETAAAILFYDGMTEEWIPKSQLEDEPEGTRRGLMRISILEWLAEDKGFI